MSTKRAEDVASGMRYLKVTGDIPVTAEVTQIPLKPLSPKQTSYILFAYEASDWLYTHVYTQL